MSMTELKMLFPTEKLDALRFFMGQKDQSIEKELQDYLDKTYEKTVPVQVRNYLENRIEPVPASEQSLNGQQTSAHEQPPTGQHAPADQQTSIKKQVSDIKTENIPVVKDHPVRSTRRQKEQSKADQSVAPEIAAEAEGPAEQEENQGMSMSM